MKPAAALRLLGLLPLLFAGGAPAAAPTAATEARVIVKLHADAGERRLSALAVRRGVALRGARALGERVRVVTAAGIGSAELARRLAADPEFAYAVPDRRMRAARLPNDPLYVNGGVAGPIDGQWYLRPPNSLFVAAVDAQTAWDSTQGSSDVVVAVLDTGVRFDHPDLRRVADGGQLLPGRDFVRDLPTAADGGGRDADATDPGDFVDQADLDSGGLGNDCALATSSWHGTQVAGILAALTDNGQGMAGIGWHTRLLPVRVLGKCGGFESDVIAGMRWAAGLPVSGEPVNPTPARILNLSLGAEGECGAAYADAVADVVAAGVTVVASAGNSAGHAVSAPANCPGAIAVGGLRHIGSKVGFSDLGPEVALSAPAGNCVNVGAGEPCLYPLLTATDRGEAGPEGASYTDGFNITVGTSFAAPLVAGTAALALAIQPGLSPAELRTLLRASARAFPSTGAGPGTPQCTAPRFTAGGEPIDQEECYCTTGTCGAGMLDARTAVQLARGVVARIAFGSATPRVGQPLTLDAGGSLLGPGRSLAGAQWQLVDAAGATQSLSGATVEFTPQSAGPLDVTVTVTDNTGATASRSETLTVGAAASGGGGGGALGAGWLLALAAAVVAAARARPRRLRTPGRR